MLSFLLDEHLSPHIAKILHAQRPEIPAVDVLTWEEGAHLGLDDEALLRAARMARLTLVSFDQRTIPDVLHHWATKEESHAGVIFVNRRTLSQNDFRGLAQALINYWDAHGDLDWTNRLGYLRRSER